MIFRSKGPDLRKKLGGTYKREKFFEFKKKTFWLITLELLGISS